MPIDIRLTAHPSAKSLSPASGTSPAEIGSLHASSNQVGDTLQQPGAHYLLYTFTSSKR
jgi:hypothetical protein